jgi:hypothetical protein
VQVRTSSSDNEIIAVARYLSRRYFCILVHSIS